MPDLRSWIRSMWLSKRRPEARFKAFISYKHETSTRFAEVLEGALKSYAKPLLRRPSRIFRDEKHLAPGVDLPRLIADALDASELLILLASPEAAQSTWVRDEIDRWCRVLDRSQRMIVVLLGGTIALEAETKAVDWSLTNALPLILREHLSTIPLYIDMRDVDPSKLTLDNPAFKKAVNGIVARFRNIDPNEMLGEEMRQHRRNVWLRNATVATVTVFAIAAGVAAYIANGERAQAVFALAQARSSELAARAQSTASTHPDVSLALAMRSLEPLETYGIVSKEGEQALRSTMAATRGQRIFCDPQLREQFSNDPAAFDVSPDGALLAVGTFSGALCVYRRSLNGTVVLVEMLQSFGTPIVQARFTFDGRWLLTRTGGGHLRALDLNATVLNASRRKFSENNYKFDRLGSADRTSPFAVDRTASRVAFYDQQTKSIEVWTLRDFNPEGKPWRSIPVAHAANAVALSPNGERVAALIEEPSPVQTPPALPKTYDANDPLAAIKRLQDMLHAQQERFLAAMRPRKANPLFVRSWSLPDRSEPRLEQAQRVLDDLAMRPDSAIMGGSPDAFVTIDDSGRWLMASIQLPEAHLSQIQLAAEAWRKEGAGSTRVLRYGGAYEEGTSSLWTRLSGGGLSPDARWLYVTHGSSIRLWRTDGTVNQEKPAATLTAAPVAVGGRSSLGVILATAVSPESRWIATADTNAVLTVWNLGGNRIGTTPTFVVETGDAKTSAGDLVAFTRDSSYLAMGTGKGALVLCGVDDACGSLEPKRSMAPPGEGQWTNWSADPAQRWLSTTSEAQRVHFWRGDDLTRPFMMVDVLDRPESIPVTSNEYVMISASYGRYVSVIPSPSGEWAAMYDRKPRGGGDRLVLARLLGTQWQRRITAKELGCDVFGEVAFDPDDKLLLIAGSADCAAIVNLAAAMDPGGPLPVTRLRGYTGDSLEFSEHGHYIASFDSWKEHPTTLLWKLQPDEREYGLVSAGSGHASAVAIDATESWLARVERASPSQWVITAQSLKTPGQARSTVATNAQRPAMAFSRDGRWFATVTLTPDGSRRSIRLWRSGDFQTPVAHWQLPMEDVDAHVAFDKSGRWLIVGPSRFVVPLSDPPAKSVPALLVDLRTTPPAPQVIDIRIEGYDPGCSLGGGDGRPSTSCEQIAYGFPRNAEWLSTANPANMWNLEGTRARHLGFLADAACTFSPDGRWMTSTVENSGTRLWRLYGDRMDDRGIIGLHGAVRFTRDSRQLLLHANGQILRHTLDLSDVIAAASAYAGENLSADAWQEQFPKEPYRTLYAAHPVHVTYVDRLLRTAAVATRDGKKERARTALSEAAVLAARSHSVRMCKAIVRAAIRDGVAEAALPAADVAVESLPKDSGPLIDRAKAKIAMGDGAGAKRDLEDAMKYAEDKETLAECREWIEKVGQRKSFTASQLLAARDPLP